MTNLVLALLFMTTFGAGCRVKMGLEGEVIFPGIKVLAPTAPKWMGISDALQAAVLFMRMATEGVTELEFTNVHLSTNQSIDIYVDEYRNISTWKFHTKIDSSNGPNVTLRLQNFTGMKIIFGMRDVRFRLKYGSYYCRVPEEIKSSNCTKSKLKGSRCSFMCKSPEYLALNPRKSRVVSRCKSDRTWSGDPGKHCTGFESMMKNCLGNGEGPCEYSTEELKETLEPDKYEKLEFKEVREEAERLRLEQDMGNFTLPFIDEITSRQLSSIRDCIIFCLRRKNTGRYVIPCGHKKLSEGRARDCHECRYGYRICAQLGSIFM